KHIGSTTSLSSTMDRPTTPDACLTELVRPSLAWGKSFAISVKRIKVRAWPETRVSRRRRATGSLFSTRTIFGSPRKSRISYALCRHSNIALKLALQIYSSRALRTFDQPCLNSVAKETNGKQEWFQT